MGKYISLMGKYINVFKVDGKIYLDNQFDLKIYFYIQVDVKIYL